MSAYLALTQGFVTRMDEEDLHRVLTAPMAGRLWHVLHPARDLYYAAITTAENRKLRLHTFLTGWAFVDHINGDGLDNRRCNLRPADHARNNRNRGIGANSTTGYKGVTREGNRYRALIIVNGERIRLGSYATPEEAARAYDTAAIELHGEFARLNFEEVTA